MYCLKQIWVFIPQDATTDVIPLKILQCSLAQTAIRLPVFKQIIVKISTTIIATYRQYCKKTESMKQVLKNLNVVQWMSSISGYKSVQLCQRSTSGKNYRRYC